MRIDIECKACGFKHQSAMVDKDGSCAQCNEPYTWVWIPDKMGDIMLIVWLIEVIEDPIYWRNNFNLEDDYFSKFWKDEGQTDYIKFFTR